MSAETVPAELPTTSQGNSDALLPTTSQGKVDALLSQAAWLTAQESILFEADEDDIEDDCVPAGAGEIHVGCSVRLRAPGLEGDGYVATVTGRSSRGWVWLYHDGRMYKASRAPEPGCMCLVFKYGSVGLGWALTVPGSLVSTRCCEHVACYRSIDTLAWARLRRRCNSRVLLHTAGTNS